MIETKYLKWIFTDLDDTLYEYFSANESWYNALFAHIRETEGKSDVEIQNLLEEAKVVTKVNCKHQWASHSRLLYIQYMVEKIVWKTDIGKIFERNNIYDDAYLKAMSPFPWVLDFLRTAKEKWLKVCVITDLTAEIQFKKIVRLWLQDLVDFIVTSEEAGIDKPAVRGFELWFKKCWLTKDDVCMLWDSVNTDVPWAQSAWIKIIFHKVVEKKWETLGAIQYENYYELKKLFNF